MDVPADIRAIANAAFVLALGKPSHEERVATIAKAIAAERDRCAKIVEEAGKPYALHTATGAVVFRAAVEKIVAAIIGRA